MTAGDEDALSTLYDRYAGMLLGVLVRILKDRQAAEELLQDIFLQLWRGAARFDAGRGALPAWLMVIARNRAISRLRSHERRLSHEESDDLAMLAAPASGNMGDEAWRGLMMEKLRSAMATMPAEQREAVELAYFEGMTQTDIAERTGAPLGTVKTRVRTAMQVLRKLFDDGTARQPGRS